jgi:Protein of unknown function (DUF3108)
MPFARGSLCTAAVIVALTSPPAAAASLNVQYAISLAGLTIGTADLSASLGETYKMDIRARLTGLVGAVTGGSGGATSGGFLSGNRPVPASYSVISRSSSDQRTVRLGLARGNVVSVEIVPPIEEKEDRVPVRDVHKRGVLDPVSALVMPGFGRGDPLDPSVCNRTLPVFDGAARFDVVLSYAETRQVNQAGYAGPVVVCNARYVPVAGHRPGRPGTKFMEDNRDISVWLAPVEGTRILMPLRISVRTMMGTSVIEATRWTADGAGKAVPVSIRGRSRTQ